ncbi:YcnI family protein [Lacisediminihabitans sp. G11-30]|uniref:YcnI family protein n=1 Tax=Lacisediminihabitans changchengi TaxID=2787634 RepID=A0A934W1P8_9MICO|nr:YcnI family protein [Lacisediminihabitans changchengi]
MTAVIAISAGAAFAIAAPLSASAHVVVTPNTAEAGSYSLVTFKVPTESATASTVKLEVDLPTATPFSSVSYVPVPGWTTELTTETLPKPVAVGENKITTAVTKVVWTAGPGAEIAPGQLQLFPLSLGPVPDVKKVQFTAVQTYSDGKVVNWADTSADADEPAPALYVNEAPPSEDHHSTTGVTATAEAAPSTAPSTQGAGSDPLARGLGIVGLVVGAVGVVLAIVWRRRTV